MSIKVDNRKKYFLVFDTETTVLSKDEGLANPLIYDIGMAVCDKKGYVYEYYNFIVENIFNRKELMNLAFYGNKIPWYEEQIKNGTVLVRSWGQILYNMNKIINRYPNITLSAYNLEFDLRAMAATSRLTKQARYNGSIASLFDKPVEFQDIWSLAVEAIYLPQKGYKRFIEQNNLFSPKGNPKTSAEVGYRYIHKDPNFIEDHTALSDVFIEVEILAHALKQKKKFSKGIPKHPWKIIANEFTKQEEVV